MYPDSVTVAEKIYLPKEQPPTRFFVLRDWERSDFTGDILRPNAPCVYRCGEYANTLNGHYSELTREWQWFWLDLCCWSLYGRYHNALTPAEFGIVANKWTSVGGNTTAFCNSHGLDTHKNYPLNERLDLGLPAIYTLVCGGASLGGIVVGDRLKVAHFDALALPPPVETIDPYSDPRVFFATTITGTKVDGGYVVNRFPQLGGEDVPVPLLASRDIFYPLSDLEAYENTQKRSPYFPT